MTSHDIEAVIQQLGIIIIFIIVVVIITTESVLYKHERINDERNGRINCVA
jgi:hypothetical protein